MNVITGLPRSGSTLLCNILSQNPAFRVSSTSALPQIISTIVSTYSNNPEFKSDLINDKEDTEAKIHRSLKAFCDGWYHDNRVIFDKSRGWLHHFPILRKLYSNSKIICCVRDLREVYASIEKQYLKNPLLDDTTTPLQKGVWERADIMFKKDGVIGHCVEGMLDMDRRKAGAFCIPFDSFVENPEELFIALYDYLEQPYFEHDFENVENVATDVDGLYLHKFPHGGSGKVRPQKGHWSDFVSADIAKDIMERFRFFNEVYRLPIE